MDLATLIGMFLGWSLVLGTIASGGDALVFVNYPSLAIVVGGALGATMMQFDLSQITNGVKVAGNAFSHTADSPIELIELISDMSKTVRKEGLLGLEAKIDEIENDFLGKGIQMCVDGHDATLVRDVLTQEMMITIERHEIGQRLFTKLGDMCPAIGMIGTLIGLVQMLSNMSDPAAIGPAMAVALLTTLYGAMIANLIAIPIAAKLELRSSEERQTKSLTDLFTILPCFICHFL